MKHQQELERRVKQNNGAEKKLFKEISTKQENDRKAFETHKKREYKANKERWKRELSMDDSTPKRQRDATLQSQKDNLKQAEAQEEQRLLKVQKSYIELEMRKFKRRKMLMLHDLESQLLRDVSARNVCSSIESRSNCNRFTDFPFSDFAGTKQKATAIGTGSQYAVEASREDARAGISSTEKCT